MDNEQNFSTQGFAPCVKCIHFPSVSLYGNGLCLGLVKISKVNLFSLYTRSSTFSRWFSVPYIYGWFYKETATKQAPPRTQETSAAEPLSYKFHEALHKAHLR